MISNKEAPTGIKKFVSWKQLSHVLIIAYDNQLSHCVEFIQSCKKDNIQVLVAVIFEGKPEQAPKPDFEHVILDKKQFSFFGLPKDECLQKLNTKPVDALINLGSSDQLKALAISKLVTAKCKIGSFENPAFEITINADKTMNSSDYLKQVIVYLNMIKTTNNL